MIDELAAIIAKCKGDPALAGRITPEDKLTDDLAIDSLQLINLVLMIENEFDIEFDFDRLERKHMQTVRTLADFIEPMRAEGMGG